VCQIRHELTDSYGIPLSDDAIEDHLASYQNRVAARHQDSRDMRLAYRATSKVVLTIDGLQPEKGHGTLYVVREVTRRRVWFAEPLLSGTTAEIRKLFVRAKDLARTLRLDVVLWISDSRKQKSSLAGASGNVVLDYCSAVRGILNDNHDGPAHPAGLRMLEARGDVQKSLRRVAAAGKVGPAIDLLARLKGFIDRGVVDQRASFVRVRQYTRQVHHVMKLLTGEDGLPLARRKSQFAAKLAEFQRREGEGVIGSSPDWPRQA
jgi:hypothetical protein